MSTDNGSSTVWHPGEQALQKRAGVDMRMSDIGPRLIRRSMPDQHRDFFSRLPMLIIGYEDSDQHIWASAIFGEPGFIESPSPKLLTITSNGAGYHAWICALKPGDALGMLGIEFETRRRNRANGTISQQSNHQLTVSVDQSFGNCNQYIRPRKAIANHPKAPPVCEEFCHWDNDTMEFIRTADTLFIASAFNNTEVKGAGGIDVSHRGGERGFLRFDEQQRLLIPDYSGNNFFNTLGNLLLDHRAGLLFFDFLHGHALHLTTQAELLWQRDLSQLSDTKRWLRLTLKKGYWLRGALPFLWQASDTDTTS